MQIQKPNYHDFIVKNRDDVKTHGSIEKRLIIDSRDRDYKLYPKSCNYVVKLNDQYKNVTSIEMVRYSIPQSGYLINNTNNIIIIEETGLYITSDNQTIEYKPNRVEECVVLTPGDYNINQLVEHIQFILCINKNLKSNYIVCINTLTGKICIKSDLRNGGFHLKFCGETELDNTSYGFKRLYAKNSSGKLLGYNPKDHLFASGYITDIGELINNSLTKTILANILQTYYINKVLANVHYLVIYGNNTNFKCDFSCYDFIRIVDSDNKTMRFLILSIETNNKMYVVAQIESVSPVPLDFTPHLEMTPEKNCMACKIIDNPNFEFWNTIPMPLTGKLINLRKCCGNTNDNINASFKFDGVWIQASDINLIFNKYTVIYKSAHCAENKYDLFCDKYLVLDIPELHRLDSNSTPLIDSFAIIPLSNCPNSNLVLDGSHAPLSPEIKYYNPPMGKIQKFTIKFLTYDGKEYDFNGREHFIDLKINMLNQQSKYLNL
tara:strand:- start:7299 stop:8774 length:1476 start_codon:yes stop_codon:yes gene_type:complete